MKKNIRLVLILAFLVIAMIAVPLLLNHGSDFAGTDGAAENTVTAIDPNYKPWFKPVIELAGGEMETLLFCLQAGIGAGILGFGFGYLVARKKYQKGDSSK